MDYNELWNCRHLVTVRESLEGNSSTCGYAELDALYIVWFTKCSNMFFYITDFDFYFSYSVEKQVSFNCNQAKSEIL